MTIEDFFNSLIFKKSPIKGSFALFLLLAVMFSPLSTRQGHLFTFHDSFYTKLTMYELDDELRAGFARADFTPPAGYSDFRGISTGMHDTMYSKAVVWGEKKQRIPLEVQVFILGDDLTEVGMAGEIFAELNLSIKEAAPFKTNLVIELTNHHVAYVPTKNTFLQSSYETINSRLCLEFRSSWYRWPFKC